MYFHITQPYKLTDLVVMIIWQNKFLIKEISQMSWCPNEKENIFQVVNSVFV